MWRNTQEIEQHKILVKTDLVKSRTVTSFVNKRRFLNVNERQNSLIFKPLTSGDMQIYVKKCTIEKKSNGK